MASDPEERYIRHEHAPPHLFRPGATYMITGKPWTAARSWRQPRGVTS